MPQTLAKVMNGEEQLAFAELQRVAANYGYPVHIKMRVADVLPVNGSGIDGPLFSFALKAHFDFVVCTEAHEPIFVVEFDGPSHGTPLQRGRDVQKDTLCKHFDLPLLRINTNHLLEKYNKASLLRWVISAWELQKSFDDAQEKGLIAYDEGFDPIMLWHSGETLEEKHPHWLSLQPRLAFEKLHKQGRIISHHTCQLVFSDQGGNYHGIEWIDVTPEKVVCVESAMRAQQFPIYMGDLFSEILPVLLHEKLQRFVETGHGAREPAEAEAHIRLWQARYRFSSGHTGGSSLVRARISLNGGLL